MGKKIYLRDAASLDGLITSVASGDLGDANTSYTYFNLAGEGYKYFTLEHIITATTLTIEACNVGGLRGETVSGTASATDGTGAVLTAVALATPYPGNTDLIGVQVRILEDTTTPTNVGLTRSVTAYTGVTGAMALSSALGAITNGVTKFRLEDNPSKWGRLVSDPTTTQWRDVTNLLTGSATHTASGIWIVDTEVHIERLRVKRVTTNVVNTLSLRLTRGR